MRRPIRLAGSEAGQLRCVACGAATERVEGLAAARGAVDGARQLFLVGVGVDIARTPLIAAVLVAITVARQLEPTDLELLIVERILNLRLRRCSWSRLDEVRIDITPLPALFCFVNLISVNGSRLPVVMTVQP
jgi:voltage-gated potassium channel Kch